MKKIFVGIDPSLTSTGLYMFNRQGNEQKPIFAQIDTKPTMFNGSINRCLYISDIIDNVIAQNISNENEIGLIVCQDYFVGRQQGVVIQLAELGTIIRYKLLLKGYPLCVVSPKTNKKYVTGNGNAKKQKMIQEVQSKWGFKASTDNLADACGMAHFAEFVYRLWNGEENINKQDFKTYYKYLTKDCLIKI